MLMDQRITSEEYFNFTMTQLPRECEEEILSLVFKNLQELMDYYLPIKLVKQSSKRVFEMLIFELNDKVYPCDRKSIIAD